jgi:hypothetical protein
MVLHGPIDLFKVWKSLKEIMMSSELTHNHRISLKLIVSQIFGGRFNEERGLK